MAIRVVSAVWASALPAWLKPYAAAFADVADADGGSVYPSVRRIMLKTGRRERQVHYAIAALRRPGILELVKPATRHRPNEYRFNLDRLPQHGDGRQMLLFHKVKPSFPHERREKRSAIA